MIWNYKTSPWIIRSFRYDHIKTRRSVTFYSDHHTDFHHGLIAISALYKQRNLKQKIARSLVLLGVVHVTSAHVFQFLPKYVRQKLRCRKVTQKIKLQHYWFKSNWVWFPKHWWIFWASNICSVTFCATFTIQSRFLLTKLMAFHNNLPPRSEK